MICNKDTRKCHTYRDDGYNSCDKYEDRGNRKCAKNEDEGYDSCDGWSAWAKWLCFSWTWISKVVCVSWYWVSNVICTAYLWVANIVCSAWVIVVEYWACGLVNTVTNFFCDFLSRPGEYTKSSPINRTVAYDTVRLSRWVYDGLTGITTNMDDITIEHGSNIHDGITDTQAVVCYFKNDIYISFRGTEGDIDDIITDLSSFPSSYFSDSLCGSKLHLGFLDAYLSVKEDVEKAIAPLLTKYPKSKIYVTGHSLGGAIATICALDLQLMQADRTVIMHNYGAPSVGNTNFIELYNNNITESWRIIHDCDLVPNSSPYGHVKDYLSFPKISKQVITVECHSIVAYESSIYQNLQEYPPKPEDTVLKTAASISQQQQEEQPTDNDNLMIGNRSEKELHILGCTYIRLIADKNKFEIPTTEAQQYYDEGYDGCYYCNRSKHWK